MTQRADRIDRIKTLLDDRRHPERRVGLFSPTNLTRLALRFGAMTLAAGLVQLVVGQTVVDVPATIIAVAGADWAVAQLWARIGDSVRRGYNTLGIVVACVMMLLFILGQAAPNSFLVRAIKKSVTGAIDQQNAKLDQTSRLRMIPVTAEQASGDQWQLVVDNRGSVAQGTLPEAAAWCSQLGAGWQIPPSFDQWPPLSSYPSLGTTFYVWGQGGSGIQVGDGKAPAVATRGDNRPTTTRAVLCYRDRA